MKTIPALLLGATAALAQQYTNPVLWEDLADSDVIRVEDAYYYSASTMHYSPGAPVLRSYNLVDWEYVSHSVPVLDFGTAYSLDDDQRAYVQGIWASTLRYQPSSSTFRWLGCIDFSTTYVYSASNIEGPWEQTASIPNCYYDAGLLIDDSNGTEGVYVAYGSTSIRVAELSSDLTTELTTQVVYEAPDDVGYIEGARFYYINGNHYIWVTRPATDQLILKSTNGPLGPYELREVVVNVASPVQGSGAPHQGAIVDTPSGDWWYIAFVDAYPGGRIPVLAPVTWDADGWPSIVLDDAGGWGANYDYPVVSDKSVTPIPTSYTFLQDTLSAEWEWNHNPDNEQWSISQRGGLVLRTASVTDDLYQAKNTLTRRIHGPNVTATLRLDVSGMVDGDVSGLALFRDKTAWIGLRKLNGSVRVSMTSGVDMANDWTTVSTGSEGQGVQLTGTEVYLQVTVDITPGAGTGSFAYSLDGSSFDPLGPEYALNNVWEFFLGYRFGIFNYATLGLGGQVSVLGFEISD
ncbi:glycosyl hydrolase/xylanase [Aspergillus cavernicola]|uniref:Glycosyl hydrolase/xylanase n=1 Tax=Aspergillus cavernicola TaxID=176166 RepID=A0ABR4HVT2_9EURO